MTRKVIVGALSLTRRAESVDVCISCVLYGCIILIKSLELNVNHYRQKFLPSTNSLFLHSLHTYFFLKRIMGKIKYFFDHIQQSHSHSTKPFASFLYVLSLVKEEEEIIFVLTRLMHSKYFADFYFLYEYLEIFLTIIHTHAQLIGSERLANSFSSEFFFCKKTLFY